MYGRGYVWIISGSTMYGGPLIPEARETVDMGCSVAELVEASWGRFHVDFYTVSRTDVTTIFGKVGLILNGWLF